MSEDYNNCGPCTTQIRSKRLALFNPAPPHATRIAAVLGHTDHGPRPVDEQRTQVAVAAFADAQRHLPVAALAMSRYQAQARPLALARF